MGHARIEPDRNLRKKLQEGAKEVAGFELYDVRWDTGREVFVDGETVHLEGHDCLCIMEQHVATKTWVSRKPLRHPPTDPGATKPFEHELPDGSRVEVSIPLVEGDQDYEDKIVGRPRQIREDDVLEALDSARNAYQRSKEIAQKLKDQKEAMLREKFAVREDYVNEAAKELSKLFWQERTGKNAIVDQGYHPEAGKRPEGGVVVNDRRRKFD